MRKAKKIVAIGLAAVICLTSVFVAHVFAAMILDGYSFELDDNKCAVITGWDNSSDTLYVPEYIGDFRTVAIDNSAFKNDDHIRHLKMTDASYLDSIGMYAFSNSALEGTLVIPTRVSYIGTSALEKCDGLTELSYSSFGGKVSAQCFQYCKNLETVVLTDYITTIERYAFYNCPGLSSVTIPRSVTSIDSTAFSGDDNLVIRCYTYSYAHQYAVDYGINYVLIDAPDPTEPPTEAPTDEQTEAPTDEPTSPEPIEVTFILGDADGDGQITILDATKIQRVLADLDIDEDGMISLRGDVNEDGLNIMDATTVQRHIADFAIAVSVGTSVTRLIR